MASSVEISQTKKVWFKKALVLDIIAALLILLFFYTALSKIVNFTSFLISIARSPVIYQWAKPIAYGVPTIELIITVALFIPRTRLIGLYASLVLMGIFTAYVGYTLVNHQTDLPCTCGGVLKQMTWEQHLVFNICFTILSGVGIWLHRSLKGVKV